MASRFLSRNAFSVVRTTSWGWQPSYASSSNVPSTESVNEVAKRTEAPIIKSPIMEPISTEPHKTSGLTITVEEPVNLSPVNGIPEEHVKTRLVRIYKPAKNAMQSGTENTHAWSIDFDTRERWENPTMGWCSTADPLSNLQIYYNSPDDAVRHCEKNGWQWYIDPETPVAPKVKSYGFNFSWNKRYRVSTK